MLPRISIAVLLILAPVLAQETAKENRVIHDLWTVMKMGGAPVGYIHTLVSEHGVGEARRIETKVKTRMKMNRLGSTIAVEQDSTTVEKGDGTLVRIDTEAMMSNRPSKSHVIFEGGKAHLVIELMGRERKFKLRCPEGMVGPYRLQQMAVEHGFKPGTEWEAETFVGDLQAASGVWNQVVGKEEVDMGNGVKRELIKMIVELDKVPTPVTTWVDETGQPLKVAMTQAGIKITMLLATKAEALAALGAGKLSPDIFEQTMVVAGQFLPFARRTTAATIYVHPKDSKVKLTLPSSPRQIVEAANANGGFYIHSSQLVPAKGKTGTRPLESVPAELTQSLAANSMIQSDEAELIAIAEEVLGSETNAWKSAQKLETWVHANLTNKGYGVGFASALEVCRDRAGDCSEHAVLLAALCRAGGIPARVAMGVVYLGGIWGGHAWNEVWIEGQWYALDATIGLGAVDAMHLTMVSMTMQDGSSSEVMSMVGTLGNLTLRVKSLELDGETFDIRGKVRVEGDRYLNGLWRFSCQAPAGFELEPARPRARIGFKILEVEGQNSAGKRCKIDVSVYTVQPGLDYALLAKRYGRLAVETVAIKVDDREGELFDFRRLGGGEVATVVVDAGAAVYVFEAHGLVGEEDMKRFRAFLKQVDFDLPR